MPGHLAAVASRRNIVTPARAAARCGSRIAHAVSEGEAVNRARGNRRGPQPAIMLRRFHRPILKRLRNRRRAAVGNGYPPTGATFSDSIAYSSLA